MKAIAAIVLALCCGLLVQAAETADKAKRLSIAPPPPPLPTRPPQIYLPGIVISAGEFNPHHRYCFCFRFKCNVPGMYNGFKGWLQDQNNKVGYFVANGKLYTIYRCDQKY